MKMPTKVDIKGLHSKELRELRNMIREELDFRADVGREISERSERYIDCLLYTSDAADE